MQTQPDQRTTDERDLLWLTLLLTLCRIVVNMTRRFVYAFPPEFSRALGVPLTSVQSVIALQAGVGISSPLFSPLAERYGRKRVMVGALLVSAVAGLMGALMPVFQVFAVMMLVFGAGKMIFDPAMQAYIGDRVPYRQRGRAIGITELSWALSLLIIAPVTGFLLEFSTVSVIFLGLSGACLAAAYLLARYLPGDAPDAGAPVNRFSLRQLARSLRESPAAFAVLAFAVLMSVSNEIFFINYGAFMELSFGLALAAIGALTAVIAAAEIVGEVIVITLADLYGKKRVALLGGLGASVLYLIMPFLSVSLPLALLGLFVLFVCFEACIVAVVSLATEVLPNARAVMMSSLVSAASFGRLSGALAGGLIYAAAGNFVIPGAVAFGLMLVGVGLTALFVRDQT